MLALSYLTRGVGTLLLSFDMPNEIVFYAVVGLAIGPTFGTVAVGNVMFYELVGPRMAGVVLGMSFIVHQIGAAGGPMIASIVYDQTGSYDGFMVVMGIILLASALAIFGGIKKRTPEQFARSFATHIEVEDATDRPDLADDFSAPIISDNLHLLTSSTYRQRSSAHQSSPGNIERFAGGMR